MFGSKWKKNDCKPFDTKDFFKRRCTKIFIPLWLTLFFVIPFEYILADKFVPSTIICNVFGLGWARPFDISGHLWYITMVMMLYVVFIAISRIRLDKIKGRWWASAFVFIALAFCLCSNHITTYSKAGPPLYIFLSAMLFAKGDKFLQIVKKDKLVFLAASIVSLAVSLYVYQLGWHDTHKAMAVGSFILAGFFVFLTLNSFLDIKREYKLISWLAGISYEVYLVHVPILAICCHYINDIAIGTPIWLGATLLTALAVNKSSNYIVSKIC